MKAAVMAITGGEGRLDVKLCQLVHLFDGGKPVRMSKRAGNFVTLHDVMDAVGPDVVRFIMLTRRNDQTLEFDYQKVREQSRSEEHTSELQSLMRISYAVFCFKTKIQTHTPPSHAHTTPL